MFTKNTELLCFNYVKHFLSLIKKNKKFVIVLSEVAKESAELT